MWLRALSVVSQITIIILALVIVITMSKKQMIDSTFSSFESKINARLDEQKKDYTERLNTVQDNLNKYQLHREQRAQLYGERLDKLYELYDKNPDPLLMKKSSEIQENKTPEVKSPTEVLDKNFRSLENKINNVDEKVDNNNNKSEQRLNILEQRVNLINSNKAQNVKVVQNNLNNQVITNGR